MEIFGPVRSRRFGMSLGINHLPPKVCVYACVYCQLGRTDALRDQLQAYSDPQAVYNAVCEKLADLTTPPDTLTFVSNGEPTLDSCLGESIDLLKPLGIPIAVISNASLLWQADVRDALLYADAVSLKVDAVTEAIWRRINRPHGRLELAALLRGIRHFAGSYSGRLLTETMLVRGVNDAPAELQAIAAFIAFLQPQTAYLALPLRAPAESWVLPPAQDALQQASRIFSEAIPNVKLMVDLPESGLAASADPLRSLLETLKVHPLGDKELRAFIHSNHLPLDTLEELLNQKQVRMVNYQGEAFYLAVYH
ncbi:MAG: hypothetical protein PWQ55_1242 [Chloroflexota bacterium]|nr:hypothetical protein [Chloroflexota bacterium]